MSSNVPAMGTRYNKGGASPSGGRRESTAVAKFTAQVVGSVEPEMAKTVEEAAGLRGVSKSRMLRTLIDAGIRAGALNGPLVE